MRRIQRTKGIKLLSLFLALLLTAAVAFFAFGCDKTGDGGATTTASTTVATTTESGGTTAGATTSDPSVKGEGNTSFVFKVTTKLGEEKTYTVKTDKTIVGEALVDVGLISGEDSQFGLYVKSVDGETLDYNTDGKYWAFYVDDDYAPLGVDSTPIEAGKVYAFKPAT